MVNAPTTMDYPQVIQYQTVQKTSEQVVVQMPVLRVGEMHEFPPYIQTTNTMTTTSIMDKAFNPYMDGGSPMHLPALPMGPPTTASQVITHQSTEMLMETDQPSMPVSYFNTSSRFSIEFDIFLFGVEWKLVICNAPHKLISLVNQIRWLNYLQSVYFSETNCYLMRV